MKSRVFLAGVLIALTAAAVFAQTEADFEIDSSGTIMSYKGTATAVTIPARIRNIPVIAIQEIRGANITSITIPEGVEEIASGAFIGCQNLTRVTMPNSLTDIGSNAFQNCIKLTSVTFGNKLTTINGRAFQGCTSLTSITLPASVTRIGIEAFSGCTSLTSVTFGGTLPLSAFHANAFAGLGDIRDKFFAGNAANGVAGRYMRSSGTATAWARQ